MLVDWMVSRLSNVQVRFVVLNESITISVWLSPFGSNVTAKGSDGFVT